MPKKEWGIKRLCPTTGKRFYDLNKDPIVSPYTREVVMIDETKGHSMLADAEDAQNKKMAQANLDAEDVILDDDDANIDVDLDDDVLDENDSDTVSLDDITDVANESDDD